jgi:hypothetical protein
MLVLHLLKRVKSDKVLILNVSETISHWVEGHRNLALIEANDDDYEVPRIVEGYVDLNNDLVIEKYWNSISDVSQYAKHKSKSAGIDENVILHFLSDYALYSVEAVQEYLNLNEETKNDY